VSGSQDPPLGTPADVEAGIRLWRAAQEQRRGIPPAPAHEPRIRAYFDKPDAFWVVAEQNSRVAGMGLGMQALADNGVGPPVPGHLHIAAVFVDPACWGAGIGGRIVDALLAEATHHGYRSMQLWTQVGNDRALRLYESRGFRPTGQEMSIDDERILKLHKT
jgi:ribosomal protein S18 acetylase RimI-like enzyme